MKRIPRLTAAACATAALFAGAAQAGTYTPAAAPAPQAQLPDWTGFFIGGHAGYGWTNDSSVVRPVGPPGPAPFSISHDLDGLMGGFQVGYNMQSNRTVWGVVADLSLTDMDETTASTGQGPTTTAHSNSKFIATLRLRGGYLLTDSVLGYVHGGVAANRIETQTLSGGPFAGLSNNSTELGFVVGAGVEAKVHEGVSVFAEYSYMRFGEGDATRFGGPPGPINFENSDRIHAVKVGVNLAIKTR